MCILRNLGVLPSRPGTPWTVPIPVAMLLLIILLLWAEVCISALPLHLRSYERLLTPTLIMHLGLMFVLCIWWLKLCSLLNENVLNRSLTPIVRAIPVNCLSGALLIRRAGEPGAISRGNRVLNLPSLCARVLHLKLLSLGVLRPQQRWPPPLTIVCSLLMCPRVRLSLKHLMSSPHGSPQYKMVWYLS